LSIENPKHGGEIVDGLYKQFKARRFCDVILLFEKTEVKAHKVVLASASRYFDAMFSDHFSDCEQEKVELPALDDKTGPALIEFAYTGKIDITQDNVLGLLAGSNFLQGFQFVEESCCNFLRLGLKETNAVDIMRIADTYSLQELKKDTKKYILRNFIKILDTEHFIGVPVTVLAELISEDSLLVVQE
ncbi:predicted protein, partial [Nematostella vectensis]